MAIIFATMMATLVYGMLFNALGVLWKYGIILAIPFAAWELGMALLSMGAPDAFLLRFSVIGWALMIVDSAAMMVWPNIDMFILMGNWGGGGVGGWSFDSSLEGSAPLDFFSSKPGLGLSPLLRRHHCYVGLVVPGSNILVYWWGIIQGQGDSIMSEMTSFRRRPFQTLDSARTPTSQSPHMGLVVVAGHA